MPSAPLDTRYQIETPEGIDLPLRPADVPQQIEIVEAAHPVPDAAGLTAAQRILQLVQGLTADDLVLCLISGGGSALLTLPCEGLTLEDKQRINRQLLESGAHIGEMNTVRKHLSAIKGGRLAAACHPARVLTLLISDVPGDRPIDIASGPTVADPSTCADALAITQRYAIDLPAEVRRVLASGAGESVKPGDPRLARCETRLIATPQMALQAAAHVARDTGVTPWVLGDALEWGALRLTLSDGSQRLFRLPETRVFEDVTTRLARWLALSAERAQMQQLHLTHEHLAQMLGVRRVSITLAAGELKERGLIAYQRGVLNILNLAGLQPTVSSESLKPGRLI